MAIESTRMGESSKQTQLSMNWGGQRLQPRYAKSRVPYVFGTAQVHSQRCFALHVNLEHDVQALCVKSDLVPEPVLLWQA